ncbi:hypothetical protein O6H91_09G009200 [Diphasiastrum complanatum]|uniref:Uncharacterized protein n=2 Tax=Diphasiastrum complanatum TaxID=34168 RepID=A0ACC2CL78_DIPCM|nr:hypothetical protein O6H91_09G009200 [Diphasiastrum complanatum]
MKMSIRYHIWSILKILGWKVQSICGCYTENPIMAASTVQDTKKHKVDARYLQTTIAEKAKKIPEEGIKATKSVRFETNDHDAAAEATSDHKLPYDTIHLKVAMHCEGCKQKVVKVLSRMDEVRQIDISMKRQKVDVSGFIDPKKVVEAIQKTGKKVELWLEDGAVSVDVQSQGESDARKNSGSEETNLQDPSILNVADELKGNGGTKKAGMQEEDDGADPSAPSGKQPSDQIREELQANPNPSDLHSASPSHLDHTLPEEQESVKKSEKSARNKQSCNEDVPSKAATNLPHQSAEPQKAENSKSSNELQEKEKGKEILEDEIETSRTSPSSEETQQAREEIKVGTFCNNRNTFTSSLISSAEEFLQELLTGRLMKASETYKHSAGRKQEAGSNEINNETVGNDFKSLGADKGTDRGDHVRGAKQSKPSPYVATGAGAHSEANRAVNSGRDRDHSCSRKDSQHLRGEFDSEKARAPRSEKLLSSIADVLILVRRDNPPRTPNYNHSSARQLDHRSSNLADGKTVQRAKTTDYNHAGKMPARRKDASCQTISSQGAGEQIPSISP